MVLLAELHMAVSILCLRIGPSFSCTPWNDLRGWPRMAMMRWPIEVRGLASNVTMGLRVTMEATLRRPWSWWSQGNKTMGVGELLSKMYTRQGSTWGEFMNELMHIFLLDTSQRLRASPTRMINAEPIQTQLI